MTHITTRPSARVALARYTHRMLRLGYGTARIRRMHWVAPTSGHQRPARPLRQHIPLPLDPAVWGR